MVSFDATETGFLKPLNRKWNLEESPFSQEKKNKPYTAQHSNIEAMNFRLWFNAIICLVNYFSKLIAKDLVFTKLLSDLKLSRE